MLCRQEDRRDLNATCRVRSGPGLAQRAVIRDISSVGCSIHTDRMAFRRADLVQISLSGSYTVEASVRWIRAGQGVGLSFGSILPQSVLDEVARNARDQCIVGSHDQPVASSEPPRLRSVC